MKQCYTFWTKVSFAKLALIIRVLSVKSENASDLKRIESFLSSLRASNLNLQQSFLRTCRKSYLSFAHEITPWIHGNDKGNSDWMHVPPSNG